MAITSECGPHCGIVTSGKVTHEGHCVCEICHFLDLGITKIKTIINN